MLLMVLGCHNVIMYNHSTFVLGYLLLLGYDVKMCISDRYRVMQDSLYESDFDKLMNDMEKNDVIH